MAQASNLESNSRLVPLGNVPEPKLPSSETPLGLRPGQSLDLNLPTHPHISDLSHIRQEPQETVHHFWARFLLVMNKVKDCREEDAISFFCKNCTDKGILNAISRRDIAHFADLAAIVQKYCAMESAWKTQTKFWDPMALTKPLVRTKRVHSRKSPDPITKKPKPATGRETVLEGWLNGPCKIHSTPDTIPTHSLRACLSPHQRYHIALSHGK